MRFGYDFHLNNEIINNCNICNQPAELLLKRCTHVQCERKINAKSLHVRDDANTAQDKILKTERRNELYKLFLTMNMYFLTILSVCSNEIKLGVFYL